MGVLGSAIDFLTLGIGHGSEVERALGLESEETALARLARKSQKDLEIAQNRAAKDQIMASQSAMHNRGLIEGLIGSQQDVALAQQNAPLVLAPDSPEIQNLNSATGAADAIQQQYQSAVAQDPYLAQATDLVRRDNLAQDGVEADIQAKQAGAQSKLYGMRSKEMEAQEKRRQQGIMMLRRSGGTRGKQLVGLDGASDEQALAWAEQEAMKSPNDFPESVQKAIISAGGDPRIASREEAQEAMRLESVRRMEERRAGASRVTQNVNSGGESFVPTGDDTLDRLRQLPVDIRKDAITDWKLHEMKQGAIRAAMDLGERARELTTLGVLDPTSPERAEVEAMGARLFAMVKSGLPGERFTDKDSKELIDPFKITAIDTAYPERIAIKMEGLAKLLERLPTPTLDAINAGNERMKTGGAKEKARTIFGGAK